MLLQYRQFLVKEHVGFMKLGGTYDIFDPRTNQPIGIIKDAPQGWRKWLRLVVKKRFLPATIEVYEQETAPSVLTLHKSPGLFRVNVRAESRDVGSLGRFQSKFLTLGGGFFIFDRADQQIGEVKGDWKGWNFKLLDRSGTELGVVTKKWAGVGKELFTNADNYMISLSDGPAAARTGQSALLLAAAIAIDTVFKENQG